MPFNAGVVVEVRPTGSDLNGGGFYSGAGGTDYSQQNSPQVIFNGTTVTASCASASNVLNLTGHTGVAADVGNFINITGGANFYGGVYEITAYTSTTWSLDRQATYASAGSGMTGNMGGALATPTIAITSFLNFEVPSDQVVNPPCTIYIKQSVYQITAEIGLYDSVNFTQGYGVNRIIGYSSARGDGGRATIQTNASNIRQFDCSATSLFSTSFENIIFDGNNQTSANGIQVVASDEVGTFTFSNCIFKNFTGLYCVWSNGSGGALTFINCDFLDNAFTGTTGAACILAEMHFGLLVESCYFAANSISGANGAACILPSTIFSISNSIFYNNTGTNFYGVCSRYTGCLSAIIKNSVFHSNGLDAICSPMAATCNAIVDSCIFTSNGGYGINVTVTGTPTILSIRNNAYYNNTSGNVNGITDGGNNQILTGLPYVSAGSNFALNGTAGAGASCKGNGVPGNIGAASSVGTGYQDIGALQGQNVGSSISGYFG